MQLTNFYTDNVFELKYNNIYNSSKLPIQASWDLRTIGNNKAYDESNIYTMCVDNDINKYNVIDSITENINHIKFECTEKTSKKNALSFIATTFGLTDISTSKCLSGMPKNTYMKNNTYSATNHNNLNALDISKTYIYPVIFAIEKSDFEAPFLNARSVCIDTSKIKQITLFELYTNKDRYYITAYYQRLIVCNGLNNVFDLGTTTPCKYLYFEDNEHFTMSGVNNLSSNYSIPQTPIQYNGFWYAQTSTGISSSPFTFISDVKLKDYETSNDNILPCMITPFDYEPTFDNETTFVKGKYDVWKLSSFTENELKRTSGCHVYTADYILKIIASQGLYVSWSGFYASDTPLKDSDAMAIGEMNTNGFTTGKILTPIEKIDSLTPNLNYSDYTDSIAKPEHYIPVRPDDIQVDNTTFGNYECKSGGVRYYGMTSTQYFAFNQWINGDLESGYEPLKSVVYFAYQPFRSETTFMADQDNVKIGGKSSVQMKPLNKSTSRYFLGSYNVKRIHNNFLDYNPYTDVSVYIPLCGEIVLPTNIVMGNTIKTYLLTDSQTGGCTGYVTAVINGNEIIVGHRSGQFVQNMPLSSNEVGLRKQAETQSLMSLGGSAVATGLGIATGNPLAIVGGVSGLIASTVNGVLSSNTNRTQSTGALSDVINFNMPLQCYIRITSPYTDINDNYGHNTGYMCNKVKQIADCSGYTVCTNIDTSGLTCTETEKEMIKNALENGCYL